MTSNAEGFWYPKVDYDKCVKCGKCVDVCPVVNKIMLDNSPCAYACINKDESIRLGSSSGGVFTLLAEHVVADGGAVFGAGFSKVFEVEHSFVETKEEIERFRGSKYVQSKIGDTYKQAKDFLEQGRKVLFTGTPCQIGGLKSFLGRLYENLFCMDLICHGVPSPAVWKKYVEYREEKVGFPIQRISFRMKNEGWKRYSVSFLFEDNAEYQQTLDKDLYMQAYLKNICLRPSCYACNFKTLHRQSDITLADFWGIQNVLPEMDDDKGTSLVFVNSANGKSMFDQIKDKILYKEVNINKVVSYNLSAIKSVEQNPKRKKFFEELYKLSFDKLVNKYCSDNIIVRAKRKAKFVVCIALKRMGLLSAVNKVLRGY